VRLFAGALGATFRPGTRRQLTAPTVTIGIRGTGVYLEAAPDLAYFCTCFGSTEIAAVGNKTESVNMSASNHQARLIYGDARIVPAAFEGHTNEEIAQLESLVGRPNPFST